MENIIGFLLVGIAVGIAYMESLALTVKFLNKFKKPMKFLVLTAFARFGIVGIVFYKIIQIGIWYGIFMTLAGFLIVRTVYLKYELRKN